MDLNTIKNIANTLHVQDIQVQKTLELIEEGNTVPFIARYRKEVTKGLDEEQIRLIMETYEYEVNLKKRKEDVLRLIEEKGHLSDEIKNNVLNCTKLSQVEDIYRPYKQKKKTRAALAISYGLEPLASFILSCPRYFDVSKCKQYINENVKDEEDAIMKAKDIIAEKIAEDVKVRNKILDSCMHYGKIKTKIKKGAEDEKKIYRMYYDHEERIDTIANHRVLAIDRGEKEKILSVSIETNKEYLMNWIKKRYIKYPSSPTAIYIEEAIEDAYERLAFPSIERMVRAELTSHSQESSIEVFSLNLEKLLLQAPMKNKTILGFDPAFRTGCKLAVIDATGKKLCVDVIYPHKPNAKVREAKQKLVKLCKEYQVDLIAIGNGTASRESEAFVAEVIKEFNLSTKYAIVSEAGASVYSASKLAIEEFPDLHVEQRSAISIARRLMDPLSELIKIDPQSIGVGQYQHDVSQTKLKTRLDFVVDKVVNRVGVNVNTASVTLLKHIAGLNVTMANNIVAYRENKKIESREELLKVPKLGNKSYLQAAGFLRVEDGYEILDRTSIHPESYAIAYKVLDILHMDANDIGSDKIMQAIKSVNIKDLCTTCQCDTYTMEDILKALQSPFRDYREDSEGPLLRSDVLELEDLHEDDELEGVVRNVVDFGAFVDIGLHEDGLVHISKMSKHRIKHPSEIINVGDIVKVYVDKIDEEKQKVNLRLYKK